MSKLNGGCLSAVVYQELQDDNNNNTFLVANVILFIFFKQLKLSIYRYTHIGIGQ